MSTLYIVLLHSYNPFLLDIPFIGTPGFYYAKYAEMSLDAQVTYTFLLNLFQLSRRKGWVNEDGEVFVIFPRKAMAQELRICEKRVIAAFRKLAELQLIGEKRCGRGDTNQIYLVNVEPQIDPDYECAPFHSEEYEQDCSRTTNLTTLEDTAPAQEPQCEFRPVKATCTEK